VGGPGGIGGAGGGRPSTLPANNNIYNDSSNKARNAPSAMERDAGMQKADRVAKGPNNVYADRNGNVARQSSNGNWQSRENGQWKSSPAASTQPSRGSSGQSGSSLNRDAEARRSGSNRPSSSYGGSYGGNRGSYGGRRGGGGGRRR
jgi:hypothetical protein